jgi:uncharacterized phage protein (TIGR01671 family)
MNREIKFRAWDKKQNKFLESCYNHNWYIPIQMGNVALTVIEHDDVSNYGTTGEEYSKDDVVLLQFTGLKDKNGKEIYEGDIAETNSIEGYGVIEYRNDVASFIVNHSTGCWDSIEVVTQVIGNIHENKDLLT